VLAGATGLGASLWLGQTVTAENIGGTVNFPLKEYDIATNGIALHVTEQGAGPVVLFCHGFPDTAYTWRRQMQAVAAAGYRAIAPDMRGYGRSAAPADAHLYTPLHTAGDLVGLLDALKVSSAVLVGHDWGATHAWNAALMRPDRFTAVFCLSVPYVPRGDVSVFDKMRKAGHEHDFYMFEQIRPDADQLWADAAVTIPGILYWAHGSRAQSASSGAHAAARVGRDELRQAYCAGIPAHRISWWPELLPRGRTLFFLVRCVQRSKDRAAVLFHVGKERWLERALSAESRPAACRTSRLRRRT
jgi:pimeloyl-ACP methyl ester carboxylesterase